MKKIIVLILALFIYSITFAQVSENILRMPLKTTAFGKIIYPNQLVTFVDTNVIFRVDTIISASNSIQTSINNGWISQTIGGGGGTVPTLNQVLNSGDSSVLSPKVSSLYLLDSSINKMSKIKIDDNSLYLNHSNGYDTKLDYSGNGISDVNLNLPKKTGTIALISDIHDSILNNIPNLQQVTTKGSITNNAITFNNNVDLNIFGNENYGLRIESTGNDLSNISSISNGSIGNNVSITNFGYNSKALVIRTNGLLSIPIDVYSFLTDTFAIFKGFTGTKNIFRGNGGIIAPDLTIADITALGNRTFTTKEYVDSVKNTAVFDTTTIYKNLGVKLDTTIAKTKYVQIDPSSAQSGSMWIDGAIKTSSFIQGTTAKLTNLTDGYIPYHKSDTDGLVDSKLYTDSNAVGCEIPLILRTGTSNAYSTFLTSFNDGGNSKLRVIGSNWIHSIDFCNNSPGFGISNPYATLYGSMYGGTSSLTLNKRDINGNLVAMTYISTDNSTFASTIQATTAKLTNLTPGYIPYHTSGGLVNSGIYYDGTNVGVGYSSGTEITNNKLSVNGSGYFNDTLKSTTSKFGSSTNYVEFESDGTLIMKGDATVFDDLTSDLTRAKTIGERVFFNETNNSMDFANSSDLTDYLVLNFQMSHKWKAGSNVYPHIHFEQAMDSIPNFLIQYRWQKNSGTKTTTWTDYKCNTRAFTYTSGTLNQIAYGVAITPPVGYMLSDIIQFRIIRDNANASGIFTNANAYTGTVSVTSVDIHYESDRVGSHTEYGY